KARTESAAEIMARARLHRGESLSGHVLATGEPVAVEDLVEDTRYDARHKRAAVELGFHGFLAVPLRAHDHTIGVLNIYTKRRPRGSGSRTRRAASWSSARCPTTSRLPTIRRVRCASTRGSRDGSPRTAARSTYPTSFASRARPPSSGSAPTGSRVPTPRRSS